MQGYRVLGLAKKDLSSRLTWAEVKNMNRDEVEIHPELIGLLIIRNRLKKETTPSIRILHEAQIKTIMVTGNAINGQLQLVD